MKTASIQAHIADFLSENHLTLSVAESLTGGMISHKITSVSGSSAYYKGGITSYSIEIKENVLGVSSKTIQEKSVVSEEVAAEMCQNCARLFNTDIALSTTGVAGPASDEFQNPVGLAFIGLFYKGEVSIQKCFFPTLTREKIIETVSNKALEMLYLKISTT
ncbi:MAG: CinA family protein [Flavobacteriaceae bacterium]|jgi:nicotinamide-nucleotide amidase|nr:CinA family protein [Flavobacteriaceae bacterium]